MQEDKRKLFFLSTSIANCVISMNTGQQMDNKCMYTYNIKISSYFLSVALMHMGAFTTVYTCSICWFSLTV